MSPPARRTLCTVFAIASCGNLLKIALVITLCLYHGKKSPYPYPYSVDLFELFGDPEDARQYFLRCELIDLTVMPDDEIQRHGVAALTESLFNHIWARDFIQALQRILAQAAALIKNLRVADPQRVVDEDAGQRPPNHRCAASSSTGH